MEIRYIELFAGIGGFRYGLEKANDNRDILQEKETKKIQKIMSGIKKGKAGFTCVYANEWDKYACQIYRKNFGKRMFDKNQEVYKSTTEIRNKKRQFSKQFNRSTKGQYDCPELHEGDITKVSAESILDHDFLTGGFPCPTYSIAGKRKGFKDPRGVVFFEICRIAKVKKPALLLLENVKGLLNHDKGNTFRIILSSLSELGYDCEWEMFNSKNYSVPQNRERVFIVGHLRGTGGSKIFPLGETMRESNANNERETVGCITAGEGSIQNHNTFILHNKYGGFKEKVRRFYDYSPAITTPKGGGHIPDVSIKGNIRRLTPTECERLQGFPDGWTEGISDTQRYKCLGNAVTTNVVEEIGKKIKIKKGG